MATSGGIDPLMQQLLDREAIRDLPVIYCHYVWQNDVEAMVNLFTEDGCLQTSGDPRLQRVEERGRANLRKKYHELLNALQPRPFIHNHVIQQTGPNSAKGTCYQEVRANVDGKSWIGAGHYDDEYAKVGDTWKFRSRHYKAYYFVPLSEGWAEQANKG